MSNLITKAYYALKSLLKVKMISLEKSNHFSCGKLPYFKGNVDIDLSTEGVCKLGNNIKMMEGGRLGVRQKGILSISDRVSINVGTMITCHDRIEIGEDTQIGPYCQILDHDHAYKNVEDLDAQKFNTSPVMIGKHVWIGANCVILRGTVIGDHCVVAAGTVVKGIFEPNSLIYTKRELISKKISVTENEYHE